MIYDWLKLLQPRRRQIDRRILIDQPNHVLVLKRHDARCYALWLPNHITELTHRDAVFFLPLHDGLEVPALSVDAEVWVGLVADVDPVVWYGYVSGSKHLV